MANPISFAASIITVATVAGQIAGTLSKLGAVDELPGRLHAIGNEVANLEVVLRQASIVVEECELNGRQDSLPDV